MLILVVLLRGFKAWSKAPDLVSSLSQVPGRNIVTQYHPH